MRPGRPPLRTAAGRRPGPGLGREQHGPAGGLQHRQRRQQPRPPGALNNQRFQETQLTPSPEVEMVASDYVEAFIRTNNGNTTSLVVQQFRVTD